MGEVDCVDEPLAWMRRWAFDGETPAKVRNENGRMAWPNRFKWLPVTVIKIFPDDVALYSAEARRVTDDTQVGMERSAEPGAK